MSYDGHEISQAIILGGDWDDLTELRNRVTVALNAAFRAGQCQPNKTGTARGPYHARSRPLPPLREFR